MYGFTKWERSTINEELFLCKPDKWFKIWFYIVNRVNFKDTGAFKAGEAFFTYEEICKATGASKAMIYKCLRFLKMGRAADARKTTRGMIVFVLQKSVWDDSRDDTETTEGRYGDDTIGEERKKEERRNLTTRASRVISAEPELGSFPALAKRKTTPAQKEKVAPATPSLEEVKAYRASRRYSPVNPQEFFDWYSTAGWQDRDGKPIKNWKLKFITWENARFKDDTSLRRVNEDDKTYYKRMGMNYIDPKDHPATVQETDPVMAYGADLTLDDLENL